MSPATTFYQGPTWWPVGHLRDARRGGGPSHIALLWLGATVVAIGLGLFEARLQLTGIPIRLGPVTLGLTVYPALLVVVLLTLWLGPAWGAVPAYLANLASALASGIPLGTSLLFSLAGPVESIILWGSLVTLNVDPELRRGRDLGRYLLAAIIAPTTASLAVLIWNTSHQLDIASGQRVWQGWILGDLLQLLLLIPILRSFGGPVRTWVDRQFAVPPRRAFSYSGSVVLVVVVVAIMGALVFQGVAMVAQSLQLSPAWRSASGEPILPRLQEIWLFLGLLFVLATTTTVALTTALARMGERERHVALRDTLTGCFNRRAFPGLFQKEADRSKRLGQGVSLIYFDIDLFKTINDAFGHEMGDRVLQLLVRRVQAVIREHDLLFRWGGEEFLVLLPHTSAREAAGLAERLRREVAEEPLVREAVTRPIHVTVSLGTSGTERWPADPDRLIAEADAACYQAKREGRNRVHSPVATPESAGLAPRIA